VALLIISTAGLLLV